MAGMFRRRGRGSEAVASEAVSFEPPRRSAAPPTRDSEGRAARASSPRVPGAHHARPDAEDGGAAELARLREELKRERAEKVRALTEAERRVQEAERRVQEAEQRVAEAERRLVQALAEQRTEAEARARVTEVARLREELTRERAEIEAELATTRRQLEQAEPHIAAMWQASAHAPRG